MKNNAQYYKAFLNTKLGQMMAIADQDYLYFLRFVDSENEANVRKENEVLQHCSSAGFIASKNSVIDLLENELQLYFDGKLTKFKTQINCIGSDFQRCVWEELQSIPFGQTRSYRYIASKLGNPLAFRAIGNANGSNKIAILVPCHRVINANGAVGGYNGGVDKKAWLLQHEKVR